MKHNNQGILLMLLHEIYVWWNFIMHRKMREGKFENKTRGISRRGGLGGGQELSSI